MSIPVMRVEIGLGPELLPFLEEIDKSGVHSNFGPQVSLMEAEFADFLGVPRSRLVSVANGTIGLQGAMAVMELQKWTIPSWTFAATAHAALLQKEAAIVFGDVEEETWALDPTHVGKGEGAVVTAPFGAPVSIGDQWNHVAGIVIDAAAAIGAPPQIASSFRRPWATVVSLHATKILGIGEGGLVIFSDEQMAEEFRQWTNFGFLGSREAQVIGTNGKLGEMYAAIARLRLSRWGSEKPSWENLRSKAHAIGDELGINPPFSSSSWVSPYWIVNFESAEQKLQALAALTASSIETRSWWFNGCHQMKAFASVPSKGALIKTEKIASESLGLPFFLTISDEEISQIANCLRER